MTDDVTVAPARPRDPDVDRRVLAAALQQFAAEGWRGFSIEAVARRAQVGKASIYLRWVRKEDILIEAFEAHTTRLATPQVGRVREALYDLALQLIRAATGPIGAAHVRLRLEHDLPPELKKISAKVARQSISSSTRLVKLGLQTGELPEGLSPSLLMDCLAGAVTNRAIASQFYEGTRPLRSDEQFAHELVDFLLH